MDKKPLISLFMILTFLMGCAPSTPTPDLSTPERVSASTAESPSKTESAPWWKDAVFYEIFVRSFNDSNGDGIGDFNGILQKLDYIQNLGVTAVWLMPIHPSPSYHGYDVLNYYTVNPQYGTMDDFKRLLAEAHKRNIKIILDLVLNHTSAQHPFFVDANSNVNSEHRDWYVWSDKTADHWHPGNGGYYYGYFGPHMPDLNYRNPAVTAQMENVTRFWLKDIGVDGFRVDAAKYLIEEGDKIENTESTHEWYRGYYTFYKSLDPQAYTVGEVWGAGGFMASKYAQQLDHLFNFEMASAFVNSVSGESNGITNTWTFTLKYIRDGDYATFLTNHDQNRAMSIFHGNMDKGKLAAVLLLTSPGTPYIYYGEEIGMQGEKPDEDIRLPMQWNADANASFTTGTPWRAPFTNYAEVNVAKEDADPNSLLNLYRTLTKLRHEHAVLRTGALTLLETGNTGVYGIMRNDENETILVLVNLKGTPVSDYVLSLSVKLLPDSTLTPKSLLDTTTATPLTISSGKFSDYKPLPELPAYSAFIFQLE